MPLQTERDSKEQVVRVSLAWIVLGLAGVFLVGLLGGLVAVQLWPRNAVPLTPERDQIVTTVQEVTISPNTSTVETVSQVEQSVVLITTAGATPLHLAAGVVVTNDGLVVTAATLPEVDLEAVDWQGSRIALERVGLDELFGLTFLRLGEGVMRPLDVRSDEAAVGYELLLVGRSPATTLPRAGSYIVEEHVLPAELLPSGLQQLYRGTVFADDFLTGSPLVDDSGRIAGILLNPEAGLVVPANELKESLRRLSDGQREVNLYDELGLRLRFSLQAGGEGRKFVGEVLSVSGGTPAAEAGVTRDDVITHVNGEPLAWRRSVTEQLGGELPLTLTVQRGVREIDVTIEATAEE